VNIASKTLLAKTPRAGTLLRTAAIAPIGVIEMAHARAEGRGLLYSVGRAAVMTGLYTIAPTWAILGYIGYSAGTPLAYGATKWGMNRSAAVTRVGKPFSPDYIDNPMAMRERQMLARDLQASSAGTRRVGGREALLAARRYG
jgi:hypothetical protein